MNFTAQETTLKLGNNKPINYESDYRHNYQEHPLEEPQEQTNLLEELKAKLRQTNFELENLGQTAENPQSMYKEDYQQKMVHQEQINSNADRPNLQKTNFLLGSLGSKEQKDIYKSETAKNFVGQQPEPEQGQGDMVNRNFECLGFSVWVYNLILLFYFLNQID